MSNLEIVANSANGSGLRLWLLNDKYEDFLNKDRVFYCAYVNEYVVKNSHTDVVDERFLVIYAYDAEENADVNGEISGEALARFPASSWSGVRVLN